MKCLKCNAENDGGAGFCNQCGNKLDAGPFTNAGKRQEAKPHPSVEINYYPRIIIAIIGSVLVSGLLYSLQVRHYPLKIAVLCIIWLCWPHIAYQLSKRSRDQKRAERRNILIEFFASGFVVGLMEFNYLPAILGLSLVIGNSMLTGGFRFLLKSSLFFVLGIFTKILFLGVAVNFEYSLATSIIGGTGILLYTLLLGTVSYTQTRKRIQAKRQVKLKNRQLENISKKLSEYLPFQLVDKIADGHIESLSKHHRKKLAIFFSDIKDFTAMTDGMEPEDMGNLLNEYFSEMDEIINKYQGTLAQVTGDALLVFLGAPERTNDKDHALRCVHMAIDMQKKMKELQTRWFENGIDETFEIRCGINVGMATVGSFGSNMRKLYTAHGMQVNIAARLEQACEPGNILISHTTWALVKDEIDCNDQGQINVKGSHKPVRIYKIEYI